MIEKDVKKRVSALFKLASMYEPLYVSMPVTHAIGSRLFDYICCLQGEFLVVETKAPKEWLRPDQRQRARDMCKAGARFFIVSGPDGYGSLERYLCDKIPSLKAALPKVVWLP